MGKSVSIPTPYLFLIVIGTAVSLMISGVVAYNFSSGVAPSVFGHSSNEIDIRLGTTTIDLQTAIASGALGGKYANVAVITQSNQPFSVPAGGTDAFVIAIGGGGGGGSSKEGPGGGGASTTVTLNSVPLLTADGGSGGNVPSPSPAVRGGQGGRGPNAVGQPGGLNGQIDGKGGNINGQGGAGGVSLSGTCQGGAGGNSQNNNGAGGDPQIAAPLTATTDYSGWAGTHYGIAGTGAGSGQLATSHAANHDYGGGENGQDGAVAFATVTLTDSDILMASSIGGGGGGGAWDEGNTWGGCGGGGASGVVIIFW